MVRRRDDEFSPATRRKLAARAAHRCSQPGCRAVTTGPGADPDTVVDVGMAAHITAAAPGGPRYDASLTHEERSAASNGIWTCQRCGKLIDSDQSKHTPALLRRWKREAEDRAARMLVAGVETVHEPLGLAMPWLAGEDSLLSYASTRVERVGRQAELDELRGFLLADRPFSWWLWTGPAGVGKSRLAVELCRLASDDWHAGFLREDDQDRLAAFRPVTPTLAIVDYAAQRSQWLSDVLLALSVRETGVPLRLLVLEREAGGPWWERVLRTDRLAESAPVAATQYRLPRQLENLSDDELRALIRSVAQECGAGALSTTDVEDIADHALNLDASGTTLSVYVATLDWLDSNGRSSGRDAALRRLVKRMNNQLQERAAADALLVRRAQLLATAVGGVPVSTYASILAAVTPPPGLLPGPFELPRAVADDALDGMRPDLVGEIFVLDELAEVGVQGSAAQSILSVASGGASTRYESFVERAARDHPDHPLLLNLLDPIEPTTAWAAVAARLVRLLRRSDHPGAVAILARLEQLADDDAAHIGEHYATARFHHANLLMHEGETRRANELFTAVLATSESAWPVHASILNNRGITWLDLGRDDLAVADFTSVIESPAASDEARACALNNRADVHEGSDLGAAIADRTAVMELTNTSPDRRYIALARRARERWADGDRRGALDDLAAILATEDIAVEQKMETRLQRAELFLQQGREHEARIDLQVVAGSRRNFDNVEQAARQLLVETNRA